VIQVGLIGYGLAGKAFHAPLIGAEPRMRLAAVATSRAGELATDWPMARAETDPGAILADPKIDLVVIATPNDTHAPLARAALEAGKAVVIDKPLAVDPAEGETLVALAEARGRMLSVFHNRRWDGDFLTTRPLIERGSLGQVMLYEARWDRFRLAVARSWKEGPGAGFGLLPDLGSHLIDQAVLLFGLPDALSADIARQRPDARNEDYFELTLHYGAMRAILSASTLVTAPRPRFAVHGTAGNFVKYGLDPQEAWMRAGHRPDDPGFGEDSPESFGTLTDCEGRAHRVPTEPGNYRRYYAGIADALLDGAPPPVDPADAVTGLRLIELARRSAAEGRRLAIG
jgi:scyllo-inositol 2-dehydrogenase (NADP+)